MAGSKVSNSVATPSPREAEDLLRGTLNHFWTARNPLPFCNLKSTAKHANHAKPFATKGNKTRAFFSEKVWQTAVRSGGQRVK
jgi:hypothetical protein